MPDVNFNVQDLMLAEYRIAAITAYNRLEPNPRDVDFDRSLAAEVRDPLWMLTRQWQFGEFQGEDAATAIGSKILGKHTVMNQVQFPGNNVFAYDETIPLETTVEREGLRPDLSLGVQMGRYFIKLVKSNTNFDTHFGTLLIAYPLNYTPDANDYEGNQLLTAVKGKIFDGYLLYIDINNGAIDTTVANDFADEIISFKNWYKRNYSQPENGINIPWQPSQLDYKFAVSSSTGQDLEKILVADHYREGHLDWYSFDIGSKPPAQPRSSVVAEDPGAEKLSSFIPTTVSFKGMPNSRFWALEDNQTDFGRINVSPTGLLHLLFAEFGLVSSNDWLMLPYPLATNILCEIKGIVVTDVFGQHILIRPAGSGAESHWQRWDMFHHTDHNNTQAGNRSFYLVPSITKSLEGEPIEKVHFLRDEMANLVWAVENIVPSHAGKGVSGDEMALKLEAETVTPSPPPAGAPKIKYVLGTTVPDNWIPFMPVHMEGSDTEIRLQRAAMPAAKGALGRVLKEKAAPYYIDEEIIRRSGLQVTISAQRTRWFDGKTYLWYGRKTTVGKGEGWSDLKFDQLEDVI